MARRRALVSVSDKAGIVDFCRGLIERDFDIVSTGGTLRALEQGGVKAVQVSEVTGVPEILDGRVKTLHPMIFGGILARRNVPDDLDTIAQHGMQPIDVIVVNLYPFAQALTRPTASAEEIIEQIDIGGPSLIRAAAKNHRDVYVLVDPSDYPSVLAALDSGREAEYAALRCQLAAKVFEHTALYDQVIASWMKGRVEEADAADAGAPAAAAAGARWAFPSELELKMPLRQSLRYGENPHQAAAFYADPTAPPPSLAHCRQIQGKELSYNNYLDADTALEMIREFQQPACVILKHLNPCGAAIAKDCLAAYRMALECDPMSAFGGIVGLNRPVDRAMAEEISKTFMEVIIAPQFLLEAREVFAAKRNLRLLESGPLTARPKSLAYKSVSGGMLAQEVDNETLQPRQMQVVSEKKPDEEMWAGLSFAWKVCKWVKSNAIVFTDQNRTLGIGAGQMSRIDAANFGLQKAGSKVSGSYLASDAFFPFRDVVDLAARSGVRGIIQPGGSRRDDESILAADEHGIVMVFTGMRHFRH